MTVFYTMLASQIIIFLSCQPCQLNLASASQAVFFPADASLAIIETSAVQSIPSVAPVQHCITKRGFY